ncbi:GDSL esterase/lipase At1g31550-like [Prosopis cineraria]|uniref:GDSL esterase/lipase At1g31550-like n=1 Tax=Prosopis cineraria TaxID=364024 RepID=UPI00240FA5AC|nr:GDSL esterase/lipase At1g31550-like [Prosopis cineraria]XP_054802488.1 GDSL esterase/lipase At1g31550-like [Prosopis cineraria]
MIGAPSLQARWLPLLVAVSLTIPAALLGCYTSIFSFGDSLTDTGNLQFITSSQRPDCLRPPYGSTHFHRPTGRCSDGRLILDSIAESLHLPLVKPYLFIKNGNVKDWSTQQGVNFAVAGATAVDGVFFEEKGFDVEVAAYYSLRVQVDWFKEFLPSFCNSSSSCKKVVGNALFVVGEIGGNDYGYPLSQPRSLEELKTYVPQVISAITSAISELINAGAVTLMVPGNLPLGCNPAYLTRFAVKDGDEYDKGGCLKWLNTFFDYHNKVLQTELNELQVLYPHTKIIYADYFNAAFQLYRSPEQFGFDNNVLKVCCGGGGPYNFNESALCSYSGVVHIDDPSRYVSWDGLHLTEAAYRWITRGLLDGTYTIPGLGTSCTSQYVTSEGQTTLAFNFKSQTNMMIDAT